MTGWRRAALLLATGGPLAAGAQPWSGVPPATGPCVAAPPVPGWGWGLDTMPLTDAIRRIADEAGWRLAYSEGTVPARRVSVRCRTFDPRSAIAVVLEGTLVRATFRGTLVVLAPASVPDGGAGSASPYVQPLPPMRVETDRLTTAGWEVAVPAVPAGSVVQQLVMDSLRARGIVTLGEALRGTIPSLVAWDRGGGTLRLASVRGRGTDGGPGIKVFVDGLEVADPTALLAGDARTVASIEWRPGPAGAALYGGDALDGVLHLRTRADASARGPGPPTAITGSVRYGQAAARLRSGDVRTVDAAATAAWRDARQTDPVTGRGVQRSVSGTVSAQYGDVPLPSEPVGVVNAAATAALQGDRWQVALSARGGAGRQRLAFFSRESSATDGRSPARALSMLDDERIRDGQVGLSGWHRAPRLRQAWSLSTSYASRTAWVSGPPASVLDSLRGAWQGPVTRHVARHVATLFLSGSEAPAAGAPSQPGITAPLMLQLAADGALVRRAGPDSTSVANSLGDTATAQTVAGVSVLLGGAAGPAQWSLGLRSEWNSTFGTATGPAWLPTLGTSVRRPLGMGASWTIRASFGASMRAPVPGMTGARSTSAYIQRANPSLAGEQLRGGELGARLDGEQWSADVAAFRQRTDGFTQLVITGAVTLPNGDVRREVQYRTVGVLLAQGIEVRGRLAGRGGVWEGSASAVRARLQSLAPGYVGPLVVGDAPLEAPQATMAASWSAHLLGGRASVSMSRVGSWRTLLATCRNPAPTPCTGNALEHVDALSRWQASYGRALPGGWQWRLRGENLGNDQRADGSGIMVAPGRSLVLELGRW